MRTDFDLAAAFQALLEGELNRFDATWKPGADGMRGHGVGGYPGPFDTGKRIEGLQEAKRKPVPRFFTPEPSAMDLILHK